MQSIKSQWRLGSRRRDAGLGQGAKVVVVSGEGIGPAATSALGYGSGPCRTHDRAPSGQSCNGSGTRSVQCLVIVLDTQVDATESRHHVTWVWAEQGRQQALARAKEHVPIHPFPTY